MAQCAFPFLKGNAFSKISIMSKLVTFGELNYASNSTLKQKVEHLAERLAKESQETPQRSV